MASSPSSRQLRTIARVEGIDPKATHRVVGEVVEITYVPRWERGRMANGIYRSNPNPQALTHILTADGRIHGWGFGPSIDKLSLPEGVNPTTKQDMASALKARVESRKPVKVEADPEPTPEPEAEKPKAKTTRMPAAKKQTSRRSGVVVSK